MSRTRTRDTRVSTSYIVEATYGYAPWHTTATYPSSNVGMLSSITDETHQNFEAIRRDGGVVLGDCSLQRSDRQYSPGSVDIPPYSAATQYGEHRSGDLSNLLGGFSLLVPALNSQTMLDSALIKAYAKMNSAPLMSGENARDFRATVSMLQRPFRALEKTIGFMLYSRRQKIITLTKRWKKPRPKDILKATSDTWLEYRYGLQPIILDVKSIIQEVHRIRARVDQKRLVVRAGLSDRFATSRVWDSGSSGNYWSTMGNESVVSQLSCSAGVMYDVKNRTTTEELVHIAGISGRDIPATLWELMPYSFVIDWFVGVGDWLQAITPNPDVTVRGSWVTLVKDTVQFKTASYSTHPNMPALTSYKGFIGDQTVKSFVYERTCNPSISIIPAASNLTLSLLHSADAMALLMKPLMASLLALKH